MKNIDLLVLDFDGVFTDGTVSLDEELRERKSVAYADINGLTRWRALGKSLCLISGEDQPIVRGFAERHGFHEAFLGRHDKDRAMGEALDRLGVAAGRAVYMGDDVVDLSAMAIAGFCAAPPGAHPAVLKTADWVSERPGGNGAVRELIDMILDVQGFDPADMTWRNS